MSKNQPTIIYLVRHGESKSNRRRTVGGRVDSALTDLGKEQVMQTKQALKGIRFDEAYSSDLKRAMDTAAMIYGKPVPAEHILPGLRERSFGSLEGKPEHLLRTGNIKRRKMSHAEGWHFKHIHDMESDHELSSRYVPVLEKIARDNPGKTVLVASHGSAIRTTVMKISDYTYHEIPAGSFVNAGYAELRFDPVRGFKVIQINGVKL